MITGSIVGLIWFFCWIIGLVYLFKEKHWGWGLLGIIIPVIPVIYLVWRYIDKNMDKM